MYFIQSGVVDVLTDEGKVATSLSDGSHFGEICLLTDDRRVASIVTATTTDLFSLSKEHFESLLEEFPDMRAPLETIALKRLSKLGKRPSLETTKKRGRLSTHIPPPPIGVPEHSDSATATSSKIKATASDTGKKVSIAETPTFLSEQFSRPKSRHTLPPLKEILWKGGEPSAADPNLIHYPATDQEESSV